jgi:SAM-dependent methyltransferase
MDLGYMPDSMVRILRMAKTTALWAFEPFDRISRLVNGKKGYPPIWLRSHVGSLGNFEGSGGEYLAYLKLLCGLKPGDRVLDIGCGCGLMALDVSGGGLSEYLGLDGWYIGLDNHRASIRWCRQHINGRQTNCDFRHIDIRDRDYNPGGAYTADNYTFSLPANTFDIILLKSVFTHLLQREAVNYMEEINRLLANKGRCLATFFLLNYEQRILKQRGLNSLDFQYPEGKTMYVRSKRPELAVAYSEESIAKMARDIGLKIYQTRYGTWSGRDRGLSYQDIVIFGK